jgi:hypothetical protein
LAFAKKYLPAPRTAGRIAAGQSILDTTRKSPLKARVLTTELPTSIAGISYPLIDPIARHWCIAALPFAGASHA